MQKESTLRVQADLEQVAVAMEFAAQYARDLGFEEPVTCQIELAVDEACTNVVKHAYHDTEKGDMEVSCSSDGCDLVVCVRDWGKSFDPDVVPSPDVSAPLERRALGGLGLYLIKRIMDRVEFRSDPVEGNELVMAKTLKANP